MERLQPDGVDLVAAGLGDWMSDDDANLFADDFAVRFLSSAAGTQGRIEGRGLEGLNAIWAEWLTPWKTYRIEAERFIDGGDAVVVFARVEARTTRDGVLMQHAPAAVWSFRDGKVVDITFYLEREEALEAVGLPTEEFARKSE